MSLVGLLARLLEPAEREAVLGDFAESGEAGWRALLDLAGLVARRQTALWANWEPWLGLVAVAVPAGLLLSAASQWLSSTYELYSWIARNYREIDPAVLTESGLSLHRGAVLLVRASLVLLAWTFTSGFTIGSLSRRVTWLNGLFFSAALLCGPSLAVFREGSVDPIVCATIAGVLLMVLLGVRLSRCGALPVTARLLLWISALVTALAVRSSFWLPASTGWSAGMWLAACGPVVYLTAAVFRAF